MNDFLEVVAWIVLAIGIPGALVWLGFAVVLYVKDERDNPDVSDKAIQDSPQARKALGDWLHAFSLCLDSRNQEDCLALEDALKAW